MLLLLLVHKVLMVPIQCVIQLLLSEEVVAHAQMELEETVVLVVEVVLVMLVQVPQTKDMLEVLVIIVLPVTLMGVAVVLVLQELDKQVVVVYMVMEVRGLVFQ